MTGSREASDWTVIGFWLADTPVVAGVVAGKHEVHGGMGCHDGAIAGSSLRGPWATVATASNVDDAEKLAVEEMLYWDG